MGLDVAGHAWVGVGPPSAAQLGLEFKDLVGGQVKLGLETDGGTYAREARDMMGELVTGSEQNVGNVRNISYNSCLPCSNDADSGCRPILERLCVSHMLL